MISRKSVKRVDSIQYLTSDIVDVITKSLSIISTVTGFEVVELWAAAENGEYFCPSAYASDVLVEKFPHIIRGRQSKEKVHLISPKLCIRARNEAKGYIWEQVSTQTSSSAVMSSVPLPVKSELAFHVQDTQDINVFIVALSTRVIKCNEMHLQLLQGLGIAMFIATFGMNEEGEINPEVESAMLDDKEFSPSMLSRSLSPKLENSMKPPAAIPEEEVEGNVKDQLPNIKQLSTSSAAQEQLEQCELDAEISDNKVTSSSSSSSSTGAAGVLPLSILPSAAGTTCANNSAPDRCAWLQDVTSWRPTHDFSYPVAEIPSKVSQAEQQVDYFNDLEDVKHLCDGSNANVFLAKFRNETVVVKMIKEEAANNPVALHEFRVEYGMLARMKHKHIIKVLGEGEKPRKFMVLEYLAGGSLTKLLQSNQVSNFASQLFHRPSFHYPELLERAMDMAEALDYLHFRCHPGATIIHRDLKPDNIGFTADGTLKLFDFGLVTCVRTRSSPSDSYQMTGYTGSLRYMAPEVAIRKPYTEKVDVYSFGIMLWQMARDRVPFTGLDKKQFVEWVVNRKLRPKLDKNWPAGFSSLLTSCWEAVPEKRPSFAMVVAALDKLLTDCGHPRKVTQGNESESENENEKKNIKKGRIIRGAAKGSSHSSTWF